MTEIKILTCNRCLKSWIPRILREPKACPKCKSLYWNKERKRNKTK